MMQHIQATCVFQLRQYVLKFADNVVTYVTERIMLRSLSVSLSFVHTLKVHASITYPLFLEEVVNNCKTRIAFHVNGNLKYFQFLMVIFSYDNF